MPHRDGRSCHVMRTSQTLDVLVKGLAACRLEVFRVFVHPCESALAVLDRELDLAARFADHGLAHEPVVDLGIPGSELLVGGVGFIKAAFLDEADDAVGEAVERGLRKAVSERGFRRDAVSPGRYRRGGADVSGAVALPAAALVLPAAAAWARLVSPEPGHCPSRRRRWAVPVP